MSLWSRTLAAVNASITTFREYGLTPADPLNAENWNLFESRKMRYALLWSMFDNSAYSSIHTWSKGLKATYGLYSSIRAIANPSYRLGVMYQTHLMGGNIDPQAGDGNMIDSALPIVTENTSIAPALAALWRDSVWQVNKDVWTLNGTIMGDAPLEVVDDTERGKVYLKPMHPGKVKHLECDPQGNVKAYTLEYQRPDPRRTLRADETMPPMVTYREEVTRGGENVNYQTYLNGKEWGWNDRPDHWSVDYGFIPLVTVKHQDVGLEWGWSELHAGLPKFREIDDIASALDDQIRKAVNAPWLFNFPKSITATAIARTQPTLTNREPGRAEIPSLYVDRESAKGQALIADLDIAAVSARITELQTELTRDYPELDLERHTASGDASGRALRYAQQPVAAKVQMRRAGYDSALVRAQQMAIAIGGMRGYPGYETFGLESYAAGALEHSIGDRPVFAVDPLDKIEESTALWTLIKAQVDTGYPLELAMRDQGFDEQKIAAAVQMQAEKQAQDQARFDAQMNAKQKPPFGG
jgi:hypothetical protein